ncbi:MAG: eukaryotic-like serine/threonine-protein kinase [Actinomycetota bacterium]|jgi:serine/threonine-protein kinase|nr:eukaryotic-like serine/threonine-protein kinase [Actinomycetota bacterium]
MTEQVLGGRYRIVSHVAKGGMAEVYLGHDQLLDRPVAIKVLVPDLAPDATFVERFRREAQAAAGLNHHNVVSVYDFGQDDGAYYIVMEYVDGPTLRDIIRSEGPMAPARVIEVGAEIAAGLAAAHQRDLLHRDMKPANVLMTASGNVKVADFGIARAAHSAREGLTMPGAVVGTATYLSPEQAMGEPLDQRSDVYSLGMVLYEMLAGRAPFSGDTPVAVAYKQVNEVPPPPSVYNPDVPPALDGIVMRALAKRAADRQQSAEALRAELLDVQFGAAGSDATVVAAGAAGGAAGGTALVDATATAVVAGPATSMMPPPTGVDMGAPVGPPPRPMGPAPSPYGRRRLTAVVLVLLAAVAAIALISTLGGDDKKAEPVTVPSVVGFDVNDAVAEINRVGLKPHTETKKELDGAIDTIVEQDPVGGATAKKGDTVKLFLPLGSSETSITTTPTTAPTTTDAPATTQSPQTTQATAPATTAATVVTIPPTTAPQVTAPPTTGATVTSVVLSVPAPPPQQSASGPPGRGRD